MLTWPFMTNDVFAAVGTFAEALNKHAKTGGGQPVQFLDPMGFLPSRLLDTADLVTINCRLLPTSRHDRNPLHAHDVQYLAKTPM